MPVLKVDRLELASDLFSHAYYTCLNVAHRSRNWKLEKNISFSRNWIFYSILKNIYHSDIKWLFGENKFCCESCAVIYFFWFGINPNKALSFVTLRTWQLSFLCTVPQSVKNFKFVLKIFWVPPKTNSGREEKNENVENRVIQLPH